MGLWGASPLMRNVLREKDAYPSPLASMAAYAALENRASKRGSSFNEQMSNPDAALHMSERVLAHIRANPKATVTKIAKGLGEHREWVGSHCLKLFRAGKVRRRKVDGAYQYWIKGNT